MREIEVIEEILLEQAEYLRGRYAVRSEVAVSSKGNANNLLTEADLAVQEGIVRSLSAKYPADCIVGEEGDFARYPGANETRAWVIDPIDGTQNFVRGIHPSFGISLGFAVGGEPVAGGVAMPVTGDVFLAERGGGAWRNGKRIHVSDVADAMVARVEVDFSGPEQREETLRRGNRMLVNAGQIRCHCATVVALCSIAAGEMDGFFHVSLCPWDYAAGVVIVEEAGGKATRPEGDALNLFDGKRGVLASNQLIHDALLAWVD